MLKPAALIAVASAALLLAGCSTGPADNADDGVLRVVASTNVYGAIAEQIGGAEAQVTSIIADPAQDPHEFEGSGRVQLALSRADVVIVNGGGYDDFATRMLEASGNAGAHVIDAVQLSGYDAGAEGFNEHVFYDYPTMKAVATAIAAALGAADPAHADAFDSRADGVVAELDALIALEGSIAASSDGAGVVITEPVPLYVLEACGLRNLTPPDFSAAIEEGSDVPPALLQSVLNLIGDGSAAVVVYNAQTGGPQTDAVIDIATENGVPAIGVTETLPPDMTYVEWQTALLTSLRQALQ
ncbi:MAG TPA: zinc ABC transporter substrate-binding protein [Pseudolysinimonas sp.]|nr:zinc ABC transporter substrate-binding protein [Pseudolysinimonas sp.]